MAIRIETIPLDRLTGDTRRIGAWQELAATIPDSSYFQTPDWVLAWWQTVGGQPAGTALMVWNEERLIGFQPMVQSREPVTGRLRLQVTVTTNAGGGVGTDHAGWLAIDGAETQITDWIRRAGPVILKGIPVDLVEPLGGHLIETHPCPRVAIADVAETMSTKLAKTLRNARRRLDREGVGFEWKEPGEVGPGDLEDLYRLHRVRRAQTGDRPVFEDPARRDFHNALLAHRDPTRGNAVLVARSAEDVVGVLYGFVWGGTFAYYQIGWDPRLAALSLGSVMVLEAIEACRGRGLTTFDFLRGADDYKYRFGAVDIIEGTVVVGSSPRLAAIRTASRLRAALNRAAR